MLIEVRLSCVCLGLEQCSGFAIWVSITSDSGTITVTCKIIAVVGTKQAYLTVKL